jgi:hypothetical protein
MLTGIPPRPRGRPHPRDRQETADNADRTVSGTRPGLTTTGAGNSRSDGPILEVGSKGSRLKLSAARRNRAGQHGHCTECARTSAFRSYARFTRVGERPAGYAPLSAWLIASSIPRMHRTRALRESRYRYSLCSPIRELRHCPLTHARLKLPGARVSGATRSPAHRIARPPTATSVRGSSPGSLPTRPLLSFRTYRQIIRVEPSSTDD